MKYEKSSIQILVPNGEWEEDDINKLLKIIDKAINRMLSNNKIKSIKVNTLTAHNTVINDISYSTHSVDGLLPPHSLNSLLNYYKYVASNIDGKIIVNKEFIEDFNIEWKDFHPENKFLRFIKLDKWITDDISKHKSQFKQFCDKLTDI